MNCTGLIHKTWMCSYSRPPNINQIIGTLKLPLFHVNWQNVIKILQPKVGFQ